MNGYGNAPFRVWDDDWIIRRPRIKNKVSWVIRIILRDCIWKPAARVVVSVKHIFDTVSSLGSSQTRPENLKSQGIPRQRDEFTRRRIKKRPTTHSSHVWIIDPGFDIERTNRIYDNDGIRMNTGHCIDQVITIGPSSQVLAVSSL